MAKERPSLDQMTLRQLRKVASDYNVFRYSRMRKAQLLAAVQKTELNKQQKTESSQTDLQEEQQVEAAKFKIGQDDQEEQQVEAAKFEIGQDDQTGGPLASVDENLGELLGGYGKSRIVLLPRDPQWAYTYWDISNEQKEELRRQGGQQLTLRIYDVTEFDFTTRSPHTVQEYLSAELAREWYLPIPVSDRDYVVEIGYRCWDGRWLMLARSAPVRIPPVYPSDWVEDVFVTVDWEQDLAGQTVHELAQAHFHQKGVKPQENDLYQQVFALAEAAEFRRVDGSIFGSMHHIPSPFNHEQVISSHIFPSGIGRKFAVNVSGLNMSGIGMNMSGVGFGASLPPEKPRKFWLIADAELIIHGATEPDANLTIGGRPVKLKSDGTFRFQMSFPDGVIDYPIEAVAVDGEQTRSIQMKFTRETPSRHTNTRENALEEWFV